MTARTKKGSKEKGRRFERLIAGECEAAFPGAQVYRESQAGGATGTPDVAVENWLHLECKDRDSVSWLGALRQAMADSEGSGRIPIAVIKDARCKRGRVTPVVALMRWEDWDEAIQAHVKERGEWPMMPPGNVKLDERKRPNWKPATDEAPGAVFAIAADPPAVAVSWPWLLTEVLVPLWKAGNAGAKP